MTAPSASAPRRRVHLVDASAYVFRAWHSIPHDLENALGEPVNAVHGFLRFALDLLERERPTHIAFAFDESLRTSFRNRFYPAYKANRDDAPESLHRQFRYCRALLHALGITVLCDAEFEADDLIGTMVVQARPAGFSALVISPDKDLMQLLGPDDEQWDYARDRRFDVASATQRFGVPPERIADWLGLAGDAIDNIPGVPGVGAKTATQLLQHFADLDDLLARTDEVAHLRIRGAAGIASRLAEHADQARLSRRLATIACDAPVGISIDDLVCRPSDPAAIDALVERCRIGPLTRRRCLELERG